LCFGGEAESGTSPPSPGQFGETTAKGGKGMKKETADRKRILRKQTEAKREELLRKLYEAEDRRSREIGRVVNHPLNAGKRKLEYIPPDHDWNLAINYKRERDILVELRDCEKQDRKLAEITAVMNTTRTDTSNKKKRENRQPVTAAIQDEAQDITKKNKRFVGKPYAIADRILKRIKTRKVKNNNKILIEKTPSRSTIERHVKSFLKSLNQ
jgi:delta 1-pyrroline-5-carboxylate dehydrogenase